jgi:LysR family glycine cleavage system transcriptional activator
MNSSDTSVPPAAARRLPPLAALRAFEAAARHASFKRAADELAVTPTAISHHVRALESWLGQPLFERRTRQVLLTAAGASLFPVLRDGLDAFAEAIAGLRGGRERPTVTLSATPAFVAKWLLPRIAAFQARHPQIDLRLHASTAVVDLEHGAADLALRYGAGPYPGLQAETLLHDRFVPVASPALGLRTKRDLAGVTLIHFEWQHPHADPPVWAAWLRAARVRGVDAQGGLHFSDESHAIQAAVAGRGVALCSEVLVAEELRQGLLVAPFGPALPGFGYHLLRRRGKLPEAAAAVAAWLRAEAGAGAGQAA